MGASDGTSVGGQWAYARTRRCRWARHVAGLAARRRPDRQQGGLRRGRVRRLRRAGRPAGRRQPQPMDCDQRLSGPGRRLRRPGGAHRGGSGQPGRVASGAAGDGRTRGFAVRVLHAGVHLRDGRGVLPHRSDPDRPRGAGRRGRARGGRGCGRPAEQQRARRSHRPRSCPRSRARSQRLRPARAEWKPVPVHRLSADPRRRVRPGHARRWTTRSGPGARNPPRRPWPPRSTAPRVATSAR